MTMFKFRSDLLSTATRRDLTDIGALMLWPGPDDEGIREKTLLTARAEFIMQAINTLGAPDLSGADVARMARLLREAPRVDEFDVEARFAYGGVAGELLSRAVKWAKVNPKLGGLSEHKKMLAEKADVSVSTIDNTIWPPFKPVVHLWAAFMERRAESPDGSFPCALSDIGVFLAVAEYYRKAGETTRPPQARSTVLEPGVAMAIPIKLPPIEISFERESSIWK